MKKTVATWLDRGTGSRGFKVFNSNQGSRLKGWLEHTHKLNKNMEIHIFEAKNESVSKIVDGHMLIHKIWEE